MSSSDVFPGISQQFVHLVAVGDVGVVSWCRAVCAFVFEESEWRGSAGVEGFVDFLHVCTKGLSGVLLEGCSDLLVVFVVLSVEVFGNKAQAGNVCQWLW